MQSDQDKQEKLERTAYRYIQNIYLIKWQGNIQLALKGSNSETVHFRGQSPHDIFCPQLNASLNTHT